MLRRYLSLAFPVMFTAVAALSYLHFRAAPEAEAVEPRQVAQQDPADPFAPPKDPPATPPADPFAPKAPAEAQPADPAAPADPDAPKKKPSRRRARRETPRSDDEVQTPFLRHLLGQLEAFPEASDEDRDSVRRMIYEADVELSDSMGPNARRRIEAANRKRGFVVGSRGPRTGTAPPKKRKDFPPPGDPAAPSTPAPVEPPAVRPAVPPAEVDPLPPPADAPKKDVFDDLFKDQ